MSNDKDSPYSAPAPTVAQPAERPMLQCWSCGGWYATTVGHDCASASIPPERATHESVHTRRIYGADRTEPPAAQPAEPPATDDPDSACPVCGDDLAKRSARIATLEDTVERQAREIARMSRVATGYEDRIRAANDQAQRDWQRAERAEERNKELAITTQREVDNALHAEAQRDALQIRYDKLKRVQDATIAEFEQAVGSLPEAKQLRAERDALREDAEIGRLVRAKLVSGNAIQVERCTIRADEVTAIDAARAKVSK